MESAELEHGLTNCRRRTVRTEDNAGNIGFTSALFVAETRSSCLQVESNTAFVEMYLHAPLFSLVHQSRVQICARNRMDHFGFIFAVGLKGKSPGERMHHAAFHRDDDIAHGFPKTCFAKRVNSAHRDCEINRAASRQADAAGIRTPLVNRDADAALDERNGKQR